ncbi:MAG: hypothetical protein ACE15C_14645 [Phycisphaerae bacterium]
MNIKDEVEFKAEIDAVFKEMESVNAAFKELESAEGIRLTLGALEAFFVAVQLQFAWRHSLNADSAAGIVRTFIEKIQTRLRKNGCILACAMIEKGWNGLLYPAQTNEIER